MKNTHPAGGPHSLYTRREVLAAAAAAAVAGCVGVPHPVTPRIAVPDRSGVRARRWAILADPHIHQDPKASLFGQNMADNFRHALDQIAEFQPHHLLVLGDLAFEQGHPQDYDTFRTLAQPLRDGSVQVHFMVGNHDDRGRAAQALEFTPDAGLPDRFVTSGRDDHLRWVTLDSLQLVNEVAGSVGQRQLSWLAQQLDADPHVPTIVCVHHNPEPDIFGLLDHDRLVAVLAPRRQVQLVLFGHTHTYRYWQEGGLHYMNIPASSFPLVPGSPLGWACANVYEDGMAIGLRRVDGGNEEPPRYLPWRT